MGSAKKQPFLGAIAGSVFGLAAGFFAGILFIPYQADPTRSLEQVRETMFAVSAGGAVVGVFLGYFANRPLTGRANLVTIGMLAGVIVGLLGGVGLSEILSERAIDMAGFDRDDEFFGKMTAGIKGSYRTCGLWFGSIVGGLAGVGISLLISSKSRMAAKTNVENPVTVRVPQ